MTSPPGHSQKAGVVGIRLVIGLLALAGCLASPLVGAQNRYLFQGILDTELYSTDTDSDLLTRNDGDIAALVRLQVWAAFQVSPGVQFYALGRIENDNDYGYRETESDLDQIALRYTRQSAPWLSVEAGKILSPIATYSERRLSTQNPLIGQPYLYTTGYPWGAKVTGSAGWFDYQAAFVSPSGSDAHYKTIIEPDSAFRPVLSFGITPSIGLRLGLNWTRGPYLNREISRYLPAGRQWRDYHQRVMGFDFQFSRGYLEFNGQLLRTRYDVPFHDNGDDDTSYYLELKYTWTPRLYGALRYQGVEASYIDYTRSAYWYKQTSKFRTLEVGLGYRFTPDLLLKLAFQSDHWDNQGQRYAKNARGHALGLQLSWAFDLVSMFSDQP